MCTSETSRHPCCSMLQNFNWWILCFNWSFVQFLLLLKLFLSRRNLQPNVCVCSMTNVCMCISVHLCVFIHDRDVEWSPHLSSAILLITASGWAGQWEPSVSTARSVWSTKQQLVRQGRKRLTSPTWWQQAVSSCVSKQHLINSSHVNEH